MDASGESVDDVKTKFTMLPGSKLTGNENGWQEWGYVGGIQIVKGVLIVNGAEISGNSFTLNHHNQTGWQAAGITLRGDTNDQGFGKIIVEGNSTITNNIFGNDTIGKSAHDMRIGTGKGMGALTISGSAQIGNVSVDNSDGTSIVVAGTFTGSLNIIECNTGAMVYGTDTYNLTQEDLNHITLPTGKQWGAIQNNAASVVNQ